MKVAFIILGFFYVDQFRSKLKTETKLNNLDLGFSVTLVPVMAIVSLFGPQSVGIYKMAMFYYNFVFVELHFPNCLIC